MDNLKPDEIAQSLLQRVTAFELEKAELRRRHFKLEKKARQARDTKQAASEAYQARQALKHPDLLSTANKAAKKAANRRLDRAMKEVWIAMLEDWKCRIIAEFAAVDLAAFDEKEDVAREQVQAALNPWGGKPEPQPRDPKQAIRSSADDFPHAHPVRSEARQNEPDGSESPSFRPGEDGGQNAATEDARKVTSTAPASWSSEQFEHTKRPPKQEILPPLGGRIQPLDETEKDFF